MGLFSSLLGTAAYENTLKTHGINPKSIPTSVNARICSYANEHTQMLSKIDPTLGGFHGRDVNMGLAARIVAYCILGPKTYKSISPYYEPGYDIVETSIEDAAEMWKERGPSASFETKIISTLSDAGVVSDEFTNYFNSLH